MPSQTHDPRDIPILTESGRAAPEPFDFNAAHAAILTETLKLADSLLRQASRDIEATLFERVFDRLRAALPELVDHALRQHGSADKTPGKSPESLD